jgi:hypothetical protein
MREFSTYLPFLFALDCLPLCFCRDGLGTPLVGCGGYAREKARRDRKSLTYYQRRPANQNHCFDAVRVFALFTERKLSLYSLFSHIMVALTDQMFRISTMHLYSSHLIFPAR